MKVGDDCVDLFLCHDLIYIVLVNSLDINPFFSQVSYMFNYELISFYDHIKFYIILHVFVYINPGADLIGFVV